MCFCPHWCGYFGTVEHSVGYFGKVEDSGWLFWYSGIFGISCISIVTETASNFRDRVFTKR